MATLEDEQSPEEGSHIFANRQVQLVLGVFAAVVMILIALYFFVLRDRFEILYSDLRPTEAAAIVAELEQNSVPYRLSNRGTNILVPSRQLDSIRLSVVGSEAPLGGLTGYELFDDSQMGLTDFAQRVKYLRALQGELARTIMMDDAILSARVHIALPEKSAFRANSTEASAAVSLLVDASKFNASNASENIKNLVSASVPELNAQDVSIIDASGRAFSTEQARTSELPKTGLIIEATDLIAEKAGSLAAENLPDAASRQENLTTSAIPTVDQRTMGISDSNRLPGPISTNLLVAILGLFGLGCVLGVSVALYHWAFRNSLPRVSLEAFAQECDEHFRNADDDNLDDADSIVQKYLAMPQGSKRLFLQLLKGTDALRLLRLVNQEKQRKSTKKKSPINPSSRLDDFSPEFRDLIMTTLNSTETAPSMTAHAHRALKDRLNLLLPETKLHE